MNTFLKTTILSSLALSLTCPSAVYARGWDKNGLNDPNGFNATWHPTHYIDKAYELSKAELLTGSVDNDHLPWGDTYWPSQRGGVAYRWKAFQKEEMKQEMTVQERIQMFFKVKHYTRTELLTLQATNPNEYDRVMLELSALEKYALYVSKTSDDKYYDSDMMKEFVREKQASREYWEGYCHAWAAVSGHYAEPMPITVYTKDGLKIPFLSGDVKALLVANYQQKTENTAGAAISRFFNKKNRAQVRFIGKRCSARFMYPITKIRDGKEVMADYGDTAGLTDKTYMDYARRYQQDAIRLSFDLGDGPNVNSPTFLQETQANMDSCENTNAGAFHIMMVNQLGIKKEGFIFDKTRDVEVWNQPAFKYETEVKPYTDANGNKISRLNTSAPGTASVLHVKTKLYYADDSDYGWTYSQPANLNLFDYSGNSVIQALIDGFKGEYARYSKLLIKQGDETEALQYPLGIHDRADYEYTLDVDASGSIIGGDWISFDRPDYTWIMQKEPFFGDYNRLGEIYRPISVPADQVPNLGALTAVAAE